MNAKENLNISMKEFFAAHEILISHILRFLMCLFGLIVVRFYFYEGSVLDNPILIFLLTLGGAFVPVSASSLLILVYGIMHIASFSLQTALMTFIIVFLGYLASIYYQAKSRFNLVLFPALYGMRIPFTLPLANGLLGRLSDIVPVVGGCFTGYYLKLVIENKAVLADQNGDLDAFSLFFKQMLRSQLFYCFLGANVAMFLIVYIMRTRNIRHAAVIGTVFGSLASFVIMIAGNLFFDSSENVIKFIIEMAFTLVAGLFICQFLFEMDYTRVEHLNFEDEDYNYYVTAVPKISISGEDWKVKRITGKRPGEKADGEND